MLIDQCSTLSFVVIRLSSPESSQPAEHLTSNVVIGEIFSGFCWPLLLERALGILGRFVLGRLSPYWKSSRTLAGEAG